MSNFKILIISKFQILSKKPLRIRNTFAARARTCGCEIPHSAGNRLVISFYFFVSMNLTSVVFSIDDLSSDSVFVVSI